MGFRENRISGGSLATVLSRGYVCFGPTREITGTSLPSPRQHPPLIRSYPTLANNPLSFVLYPPLANNPLIRPTGARIKPHDVYAPVRPSLVPIMLFKRTVAAPYSNRGVRSTARETTRGRYDVRGSISIRERRARPCTVVTSIEIHTTVREADTTAAREIRKILRLSGNEFSKFKSRHSVREHV